MRRVLAAVSVFALAAPAVADDGIRQLEVDVGKTIRVPVGDFLQWFCEPPSPVIKARVIEGDPNIFEVTGRAAGQTTCRVGGDPLKHVVFNIVVNPSKKPPAKPKR